MKVIKQYLDRFEEYRIKEMFQYLEIEFNNNTFYRHAKRAQQTGKTNILFQF